MLGSKVLSVRLGGIYALQSLADQDPKQYRDQIVALLSTFVNDPVFKQVGVSVDVLVAETVMKILEGGKSDP